MNSMTDTATNLMTAMNVGLGGAVRYRDMELLFHDLRIETQESEQLFKLESITNHIMTHVDIIQG